MKKKLKKKTIFSRENLCKNGSWRSSLHPPPPTLLWAVSNYSVRLNTILIWWQTLGNNQVQTLFLSLSSPQSYFPLSLRKSWKQVYTINKVSWLLFDGSAFVHNLLPQFGTGIITIRLESRNCWDKVEVFRLDVEQKQTNKNVVAMSNQQKL